jgi:hypothetical protein
MLPLSRPTLDHTPCMVQIQTFIPKAQIFQFENFWVDQPGFIEVVQSVWQSEIRASNSATRLTAKFKLLRKVLKRWARGLSRLKDHIRVCNQTLVIMDKLEENRTLFIQERNFRGILKKYILKLLQFQKEYWKQRYTVRWTKLGDESTKFFHATSTERYRLNTITSLDTWKKMLFFGMNTGIDWVPPHILACILIYRISSSPMISKGLSLPFQKKRLMILSRPCTVIKPQGMMGLMADFLKRASI